MSHVFKIGVALLLLALLPAAVGTGQARPPLRAAGDPASRGVIVLPGAPELAARRRGDTALLRGQRVTVEMTDPKVGALVRSAALGDAALARALSAAGVAAEVNRPRYVLPITPTAELFGAPRTARPEGLPGEPDFWHVEQVGADLAHRAGTSGGPGTIVGVIDTGVYTGHALLAGSLLPGFDFVSIDSEPEDEVGHGTHVAGIVHSICPQCSILPVKVLGYYGGDDYSIARGIRFARQRGARVIQISLGGPGASATLCQAVHDVEAAGALVVIAAGNAAASDASSIGYPGMCSANTLLVSATDRYDIPAWFSNYGPAVDLAAPGVSVWSSVPPTGEGDLGFMAASGTSMAAPHVSGAAALLWSAHPGWTAAQVRAQLLASARAVSVLPGIDDVYGPRLDVAQALGLASRPLAVGLTVDRPIVPPQGTGPERTVAVRVHVRGDAITAVELQVARAGVSELVPMAALGGEVYGASYVVPATAPYARETVVRAVATNGAGAAYSATESVLQDGAPYPPPSIGVVGGPARQGVPAQIKVEWLGAWNGFRLSCGGESVYRTTAYRSDQNGVCTFDREGDYYLSAGLYFLESFKSSASALVRVWSPHPVFAPIVQR